MMNFALITALFCTYSWISVSGSEFHTVEVQPGEEVTLLCSNFTKYPAHVFWFKVADRLNISCISSMITADGNVSLCDGFQNGKFNMTSNSTTLFLGIKQVDLSDAGLYFCGVKYEHNPVIVSATFLKVSRFQENPHEKTSWILGAVAGFIIAVITGVAVKTIKRKSASNEAGTPQRRENLDSDELNDAAQSSYLPAVRSRRPASESELETHVIYAISR